MKPRWIYSMAIVAAYFANPPLVLACECRYDPDSTAESRVANLRPDAIVFSGRTLQVTTATTIDQTIVLQVLRGWRGVSTRRVTVLSSIHHCGPWFEQDQEYLVIAYRSDGRLIVLPCSDTGLIRDSESVIQAFGAPSYEPSATAKD